MAAAAAVDERAMVISNSEHTWVARRERIPGHAAAQALVTKLSAYHQSWTISLRGIASSFGARRTTMRSILVDHARTAHAQKRGGGARDELPDAMVLKATITRNCSRSRGLGNLSR